MNNLRIFKKIVKESNYDNTYKMAFARSLVEYCYFNDPTYELNEITLTSLSKYIIKYYWDQTIFFNLIQGSNTSKPPIIVTLVKDFITLYKSSVNLNTPIKYMRAENYILTNLSKEYNKLVNAVASALKKDVSYRFLYLDKVTYNEIYSYSKGDNSLFMSKELMISLKDNHEDLFDLINYRWGLILETFNSSPRVNKKVKIIDEQEIKRKSLTKYKKILDLENKNHKCFICGNTISSEELSIDHVIPWSYLYSDDIWNLVYVCKSCNSSKNNFLVDELQIAKLQQRNIDLYNILESNNIDIKLKDELSYSINNNLVQKYWINCKS